MTFLFCFFISAALILTQPIDNTKLTAMRYAGLTEGTDLVYYPDEKILGFKALGEYCTAFLAAPDKPEGFTTQMVCGCLAAYEEKMERHGCIRASRFWLISKHNVERLKKNNIIVQRTKLCEQMKVGKVYRHAFKLKMEMVLLLLPQLAGFAHFLPRFVG